MSNTSCYESWFRVKRLKELKISDPWSICLSFPSISSFSLEELKFPSLQSWHCGLSNSGLSQGIAFHVSSCSKCHSWFWAVPASAELLQGLVRRRWRSGPPQAGFEVFLVVKNLLLKLDRVGFNLFYRLCFSCVLVMVESCNSLSGKDKPVLNPAWEG